MGKLSFFTPIFHIFSRKGNEAIGDHNYVTRGKELLPLRLAKEMVRGNAVYFNEFKNPRFHKSKSAERTSSGFQNWYSLRTAGGLVRTQKCEEQGR